MADLARLPRSELTPQDLARLEEYEFNNGPLSVLQSAVQDHSPVLISVPQQQKLLARVKAFDRHSNMVLENVKEVSKKDIHTYIYLFIFFFIRLTRNLDVDRNCERPSGGKPKL